MSLPCLGCGARGPATIEHVRHPAQERAVRTLVERYLRAMVQHDWEQVCETLQPPAQPPVDGSTCLRAMQQAALDVPGQPPVVPDVHPERANEDLASAHVTRVDVLDGGKAQISLSIPKGGSTMLLAVRHRGRWLLAQHLTTSIPADAVTVAGCERPTPPLRAPCPG